MKPTIIEFVRDPQLLGLSLSPAQEALLRAIYGLPLEGEQLELFNLCTGRNKAPTGSFAEVTVIAGARSGKDSRIAAPIVLYEALFGEHERRLSKGERGVIPLVAQDLRATRVAFGYVRDYLTQSPVLASAVEEVLSSEILLTNGMAIFCFPCTMRSLRGWSIPAAVLDELAFYRLEGAVDSDEEIQTAVRRGMVAFPSPRLVKISTPYMRSGVLFHDFETSWGHDDPDLLVWRAPTWLMNPTIAGERLERVRRLDPVRFTREFEAEFTEDLDAFLPFSWVQDAIMTGIHEVPPSDGLRYTAAVDPSGGGADSFALSIVHTEGTGNERVLVQDVARAWGRTGGRPPELEGVIKEIAALLDRYRLRQVFGDRYAGQWVRQAFQREGITYKEVEADKSAVYLEVEPLFAQGRIRILDVPQLAKELTLLERRPRPGGKVVVDHPRGGHDDLANALAIAAYKALCAGATDYAAALRIALELWRPSPWTSWEES